jgi:hypothetical protein
MLRGGGTSDLTLAHLNFWPVSSLTLLTGSFKFGLGVSLLFLLTVLFLHSNNLAPQPFGIVVHASALLKQSHGMVLGDDSTALKHAQWVL